MKCACFLLCLIVLMNAAECQSLAAPKNLRCELLLHTDLVRAAGMETNKTLSQAIQQKNGFQIARILSAQPSFDWTVDTSIKHVNAWRILVASSFELLNNDKADYWDSKKALVKPGKVIYAGKPLVAGKEYFWRVVVWNENSRQSAFSKVSSFFLAAADSNEVFAHHPLSATVQQPVEIVKKENGGWFLDFGKDAFAQLRLQLSSEKNDSIWIEVGEALDGPAAIQKTGGNIRYKKISLFLKKGLHDYTIEWPADAKRNSRNPIAMPAYIGEVFPFRYLGIEKFTGNIDKKSVQRKIVFYPFDEKASSFVSSDTVLNKVWELCKYSVKATSFTGYYVDGDRERVPYEADALINQLSHYSVDAAYSMARRSMEYLLFHPTWPTEWSLQNVPLAWNDYLYTGDDLFIRRYYEELQKKILMQLAGANGLISTLTNKQTPDFLKSVHINKAFDGKADLKDIVDWPQSGKFIGAEKEYAGETDGYVFTTYNAVVNAWYYRNLVLMQQIALTLNKKSDASFYGEKATAVYQSFQQIFRDTTTGLIKDGDSTNHHSLHANMFALAFGLVPKSDMETVTAFIKTRRMACSVYGAQFLLDALYDAGEGAYALELLSATTQRSWYNMIRTGSTISMEAWDKLYKPNLDLNHAWGAAPANIIVRKLMGVEPLTPGGELIQIKPQLGSLSFARLETTMLKGKVFVSCKKNADEESMEVIIPGDTKANIYLASDLNKTALWMDGKRTALTAQDGFFIIKNVSAGRHFFIKR